jgi:predicted molibdopterin-dependent oxidoreductase YjgC
MILVVGSNTTEAHPIASLHIKWARSRGARVIVIDPRRIALADEADLHLQLRPGTNVALFNALFRVIEEEDLCYREFIESRTEGFGQAARTAFSLSLEEAEQITGVPRESIEKAARMYGSSKRAMIVSGLGVDEHEYGTEGMLALINLALATGNIGVPGAGLLCLRGQNNVQGACDMGCYPHVLPGYRHVTDPEARRKFSERWGAPIPDKVGLTSSKMMESAREGGIKALYIWGEDPAHTHGDTLNIRKSLASLEFLVYQDLFLTETARHAHVILPAVSFAEKEGTFTNTERRVRLVRQAVPPVGSARPDWQIFQALSNAMGLATQFTNTAEIYDEMASLTYYFRGISHRRLGAGGIQWPCTNDNHIGTERLYMNKTFPIGKARFHAVPYREPSEKVTDKFPFVLMTGRRLYHFNNAAQTRRTPTGVEKKECLDLNPKDIERLLVRDGQQVRISSRRGSLVMPVRADSAIREGTAFASFHDPAHLINTLTGGARDAHTDTYSYKFTAVCVEGID